MKKCDIESGRELVSAQFSSGIASKHCLSFECTKQKNQTMIVEYMYMKKPPHYQGILLTVSHVFQIFVKDLWATVVWGIFVWNVLRRSIWQGGKYKYMLGYSFSIERQLASHLVVNLLYKQEIRPKKLKSYLEMVIEKEMTRYRDIITGRSQQNMHTANEGPVRIQYKCLVPI